MPRLKVTSPASIRIEYEFGEDAVSIGRELDNLIVLDDPKASRHHAEVVFEDGSWWLSDLGSTHGVWMQGKSVKKLLLKDRDSFTIGDHKFRFALPAHGGVPAIDGAASSDSVQRGKKQKHKRPVPADAAPKGSKKKAVAEEAPAPVSTPESGVVLVNDGREPVKREVNEEIVSLQPPVSLSAETSIIAPEDVISAKAPPVAEDAVVVAEKAAVLASAAAAGDAPPAKAPGTTDSDRGADKKPNYWILIGAGIFVLAGAIVFLPVVAATKGESSKTSGADLPAPVRPGNAPASAANEAHPIASPSDAAASKDHGAALASLNAAPSGGQSAAVAKVEPAEVPAKKLEMLLPPPANADLPPAMSQPQSPLPKVTPKADLAAAQPVAMQEIKPKTEIEPKTDDKVESKKEIQPAKPEATAQTQMGKVDVKQSPLVKAEGDAKAGFPSGRQSDDLGRILLQEKPGGAVHPPVLSPDLMHVLHLSCPDGGNSGFADLMLDQKVIRAGIEAASAAELRFSSEGSQWMAFVTDRAGQKTLTLPDRSYTVRGQFQAALGSSDFSTVAHVERLNDEDALFLNGVQVSAYSHITAPRLGCEGKHWAYIAMKQLDAEWEVFAPGERVVTDAGKSPIHDHISELTLDRTGQRVAYISHGRHGAQTLWLDGKAVCEAKPRTGRQISQLTFAPAGSRFAWVVISKDGEVECHADGGAPLVASVAAENSTPTMLSRAAPSARIIFSDDGKHVAFATVGQSAVIVLDGAILGRYPSAQAESLVFSPDGSRLAYVALHPLRVVEESSEGIASQPHAAVLNVNATDVHTAPVSVHKVKGGFPVIIGGFGQCQFSPDSAQLAYLFAPAEQHVNGELRRELWIDRRKAWTELQPVEAFKWVNRTKLRLANRRDNSLWLDVLRSDN